MSRRFIGHSAGWTLSVIDEPASAERVGSPGIIGLP